MITLINESLIPDNQLATNELITLKGKGSNIMHGRLIKGVAFAIGNLHVSWNCCAVPIDDEMILGLDFLARYHGIVNIKECTISLKNNTFQVNLISNLKQHPNSYVQIQRTMCIPPNTIVIVPVQLENQLTGEYVVSTVRLNSELLVSLTLGRGNITAMSFINDSCTAVKIKEGTVVREAEAYAESQEEKSHNFIRKQQSSAQVDDEHVRSYFPPPLFHWRGPRVASEGAATCQIWSNNEVNSRPRTIALIPPDRPNKPLSTGTLHPSSS
uniref:Uncharacterized protein n=1 Tax=Magallana gigas TaxID=29159 RepID=K1Q1J5_MAGGI